MLKRHSRTLAQPRISIRGPLSFQASGPRSHPAVPVYRAEFERLRRQQPQIDQLLFRFLTNEIRLLNERLLEALYLPVEKRVRRRLLELARLYPAENGKPLIALTQEALAELTGATRATVNQVLREEERRGTLQLQRGKTRILDLEALAKRARARAERSVTTLVRPDSPSQAGIGSRGAR